MDSKAWVYRISPRDPNIKAPIAAIARSSSASSIACIEVEASKSRTPSSHMMVRWQDPSFSKRVYFQPNFLRMESKVSLAISSLRCWRASWIAVHVASILFLAFPTPFAVRFSRVIVTFEVKPDLSLPTSLSSKSEMAPHSFISFNTEAALCFFVNLPIGNLTHFRVSIPIMF